MSVAPAFQALHVSHQSAAVTVVYFHRRLSSIRPSHIHVLNNLPGLFSPAKDEDGSGAHSRETTRANGSVKRGLIAGFLARVPCFHRDYRKKKHSPRISSDASLFKVESAL